MTGNTERWKIDITQLFLRAYRNDEMLNWTTTSAFVENCNDSSVVCHAMSESDERLVSVPNQDFPLAATEKLSENKPG